MIFSVKTAHSGRENLQRRSALERVVPCAVRQATLVAAIAGATQALAAPPAGHRHHLLQHNNAAVQPQTQAPAGADTSPVIARMGTIEVHSDDAQKIIANLSPADRAALVREPKAFARVLGGLLSDRFLLQEALAKHWDQQPAVMAALERLRENAIVQGYVQSQSMPPADFPTEADIQAAYDANKAALLAPKQYRLAQIYVSAQDSSDPGAETAARNKILAAARLLRDPGADFAAIARAQSEAKTTAARGGDIGWLSEAQLVPDIKSKVLALAKGGVTDPIRLADGWQIIKLVDIKPEHTLTLAEVHDALKQRLRQQRAQELQRAYIGKVIEANPIAVDEIALQKLVGASGQASQ
jgi:parvulin-like peptidyl-prolyl isomerase